MLEFYRRALLGLACLLIITALVTYLCVSRAFLHSPLIPAEESAMPWEAEVSSDAVQGGASSVNVEDDKFSLSFDFTVSDRVKYPFATVAIKFKDELGEATYVDLSRYDTLSFSVKCSPENTLSFTALTVDEKITRPDDLVSHKAASTFFSCGNSWRPVEIDLTRLETPGWWYTMFDRELSEQGYRLDRVPRLNFSNSWQSPMGRVSEVRLDDLVLSGHDWSYMYILGGSLLVLLGGYLFWGFRQHTRALMRDLEVKAQKDRSLVAYQQVFVEPRKNKARSAILQYMATEYSNPELNLDTMVSKINVTRTKINEILKSELGYTFSAYLNKLRLTEAARLLAGQRDVSIAEIAYSVGYKNVSYFNKLFKEEYGCTPKTFRELA